jgi:uracil-DNA glycosylase
MSNDLPSLNLAALTARIAACRVCRDAPRGTPLPHEPRPVFQISPTARLVIASQAPGLRAHVSGIPFDDPSGRRLREWLDLTPEVFYDSTRIAIAPMSFCFPGYDAAKTDLPPRRECAPLWLDELFAHLPQMRLLLTIGRHAQAFHAKRLGQPVPRGRLDDIVRHVAQPIDGVQVVALPHPSWRNTGWLNRNPWFAAEILPMLRCMVQAAIV